MNKDKKEQKERPIFNFNFHGTVGQNIGNVEHMEVHFDKDAKMMVSNVETAEINKEKKDECKTITSESVRPHRELAPELQTDEAKAILTKLHETGLPTEDYLCHFIHPAVTDDDKRLQIHREIENLVHNYTSYDICQHLKGMVEEKKILLPPADKAYEELTRMGMDTRARGNSKKNFESFYPRKTQKV